MNLMFFVGGVDLGLTFHVTYVPIKASWICIIAGWTRGKGISSCLPAEEVSLAVAT